MSFIAKAGIGGSLLVLLALLITFFKQLIALIGFLSVILKVGIVLLFIAVIAGVGFLVFKAWNDSRRVRD